MVFCGYMTACHILYLTQYIPLKVCAVSLNQREWFKLLILSACIVTQRAFVQTAVVFNARSAFSGIDSEVFQSGN